MTCLSLMITELVPASRQRNRHFRRILLIVIIEKSQNSTGAMETSQVSEMAKI